MNRLAKEIKNIDAEISKIENENFHRIYNRIVILWRCFGFEIESADTKVRLLDLRNSRFEEVFMRPGKYYLRVEEPTKELEMLFEATRKYCKITEYNFGNCEII